MAGTKCVFCGATKDATRSSEANVDCCTACVWKYDGPPAAYCLTAEGAAWLLVRHVLTRHPCWFDEIDLVLDGIPFIDATKFATFKDWIIDAHGQVTDVEKRRFQ